MPFKNNVLIVDDDPANRRLLADLVIREGCDAISASGGAEALAILAREPIDLVLLDIMMPDVDGMAVLAELQKRGALPALPVVVVTAHDDRKVRIDALTAGAVDFLTKPIDRMEVTCKIRTLIELKRLRERLVGKAEEALRESDHRRRLSFEQSPAAKIDWDTSFCVTAWNPAAEKLFGYPRAEAIGRHVSFIVPETSRPHVDAIWRGLLVGAANESTNDNVTKDERTIVCEWHNAPLSLADGTIVGVSSVVLDITDRTHLQEALVQSRKMDAIGKLAGGVAHDFNNILAVILSYGSFVLDELPEGNPLRDDLVEVLKAANRAVGLTRQLLTFSRQQPTTKRPTDLNDSLAQIHQLLARTVGEHIALSVVPCARPAVVRIDPVQFDQVVLNLAVNARDAMPDGGRLRIALHHPPQTPGDERRVRLTVTDTGIGIDEQTQQRIFEPFFTTKEKGKGTGLGLATCFGIVEDVGGTLRVKSAPGQGTTFTAELPLCAESVDPDAPERGEVQRLGRGENVLVAEDEPALRRVALRALESAGYTVHLASDGREAIRRIDELGSRLDVIFTDIVMPECSGYDVAEHAARVVPGAAVILTSGFLDEAVRRNHRDDLPVVWKPVLPRDLVRAVAAAVASKCSMSPTQPLTVAVVTGDVVLVVEDDEAVRDGLVRVLAAAGYSTRTAATLAAARLVLETESEPQLVLCDLSLPDGSGTELLDWIRSKLPALCPRVFVLTGGEIDAAGGSVVDSDVFRVLTKPIESKQLLEILAGARHASPMRERVATPAKRQASPSRSPASVSGPLPRRERVLVVDDNEAFAAASTRILEHAGFEVVVAATLGAARSILASGELDAMITDILLPDGSGLDLLREVRRKDSALPVVMMTIAPSVESATQAIRGGVSEYLPKPFPADELVRVVRAAVEVGRISRLRTKLLAARFGGDEFVGDLPGTERRFALALPKIRMAFQPIVRSGDGSVFGYEALLRCDEPSLSSPMRLLAAAEVLGRVNDVGRAVRASVAATVLAHRDRLEAIFVNLHPLELRADLLAEVTDPLMPLARRVVLEVTERASLEGGPKLDDELRAIRELGYRIAVDDLGEGYAGLSSLVNLRPDIAKIDMSLVRDVHRAPLKRDIIAALVDMARRSGIVVVAEGIETVEERDTLVDLGCDLLQGYLFANPGPPFPVPRTTWES